MSRQRFCAALSAVAATFFGLVSQSWAQSSPQDSSVHSYATVSIKPDKSGLQWHTLKLGPGELTVTNETLQMLIRHAYQVEADQIHGGPNWVDAARYDIEAKMEKTATEGLQKPGPDQGDLEQRRMLQALLADRFQTGAAPRHARGFGL